MEKDEKTSVMERILSKVVGTELSVEELDAVSGGKRAKCPDGFATRNPVGGCDDE